MLKDGDVDEELRTRPLLDSVRSECSLPDVAWKDNIRGGADERGGRDTDALQQPVVQKMYSSKYAIVDPAAVVLERPTQVPFYSNRIQIPIPNAIT